MKKVFIDYSEELASIVECSEADGGYSPIPDELWEEWCKLEERRREIIAQVGESFVPRKAVRW